jgi:signal transduction histidine kinase
MIGSPPGKRIDSAPFDVMLAAVLCCILLGLAWLQFRWIGQVSQAEHDRLEANLNSSAVRFAQDFDGELERMMRGLLGGDGPPRPGDGVQIFQSRLAAWRQTSRFPGLVKAVYLADGSTVPEELRPLADQLGNDGGPPPPPDAPPPPILVDAKVPALALPLPGEAGLLVELDLNFIRETVLPELAARDLGGDYLIQIAETESPETVIFQSSAANGAGDPGVKFPVLNLRLGPPQGGRPRSGPGRPPPPPPAVRHGPPTPGKGPPKGKGGPRPEPGRDVGPWTMTVHFTSGPVEATVNWIRVRNLAVSFGMLLLVGVSGVMLVFSTRRARRLAQQQMEFVAGVTHELRTPLSVISSASQNLADGVTTTADQVKRYGTVIRDQATRLGGMVEQVLRFAGMSSDRYEMQWQTMEIGPVIEQALQECAPEFQRTGTLVERHIAPGLPKLEGDPAALGQCLRNLLENAAIHGARRNGPHALDPAHVTIGAEQRAGSIEVRVEDNGPGIDSSTLPHLFEPFYRGRRAIEDQIHGTGLGLSLVKHIMDAHGGAVEVRSTAMEGTCFTLKLPVRTD